MKKLLNTLYITSPDRYLSLDGENIAVRCNNDIIGRVPLHNIDAIITYGYTGASPALMAACAERNISLSFMSGSGRFLARICGKVCGNVTLRREQYRIADNEKACTGIGKNIILGKVYNSKWIIMRAVRDYPLRVDVDKLKKKACLLSDSLSQIKSVADTQMLRGIEGEAASVYFSVFDDLILQQKEDFFFNGRNKRPPIDKVNAMLSFAYTLLTSMCNGALEAVGLDPYVGFIHKDRPGRVSLALDLMEELRSVFADRFVLTLINKRMITSNDFITKENGAVILTDDARKTFIKKWQERKIEIINHPFLNEKIEWGLVPYVQAMLLARFIRDDIDEYPPFLWK